MEQKLTLCSTWPLSRIYLVCNGSLNNNESVFLSLVFTSDESRPHLGIYVVQWLGTKQKILKPFPTGENAVFQRHRYINFSVCFFHLNPQRICLGFITLIPMESGMGLL